MNELDKIKYFAVTGCAGFIGSNLVDYLLSKGHHVIGLDNLSTGKRKFLDKALLNTKFQFYELDLLNNKDIQDIIRNCEIIYHLAANADIRFGSENPRKDLEQNTIVTHNILEAMRKTKFTKKIVFSSTGSIYGEADQLPTPETVSFPIQTSLYGASKLACEGLISAYCETFGFQAWIFRFVSILGPRYAHGHVFDFVRQLRENPKELKVLGDGNQTKSYLHVNDCIAGIEFGIRKFNNKVNIINLGYDGYISVKESVKLITLEMGCNPKVNYGTEARGWIGDNPFIYLDTKKINSTGWSPKFSIEEGIKDTVGFLKKNLWLIDY